MGCCYSVAVDFIVKGLSVEQKTSQRSFGLFVLRRDPSVLHRVSKPAWLLTKGAVLPPAPGREQGLGRLRSHGCKLPGCAKECACWLLAFILQFSVCAVAHYKEVDWKQISLF